MRSRQRVRIGQLVNQTPPAQVFEEGWHRIQPATPGRSSGGDYRRPVADLAGQAP